MAHIEQGGDKKSVDVHLNIVPFIDLMSCLTAFLLVTAVWTNLAQIRIKPKGIGRDSSKTLKDDEPVRCSVLLQEDTIWIGLSRVNDFRKISKEGDEYNWESFDEVLTEFKAMRFFTDRQDIEIAAEDKIPYQTIITAMDKAILIGFVDVGLSDPASLSARPQL
jgi:biopolymer transport protein ExbD